MSAADRAPMAGRRWPLKLVLAVLVGALAPIEEGCAPCPELDLLGTHSVSPDREDWVPGSGTLEVSDTSFVLAYTTLDGSKWEVEYRRKTQLP
jgi:hypothetical protein